MPQVTKEIETGLKDAIYDFFSEQCELGKDEIAETMSIEEDLGGDSLMFLELIESIRGKYNINIELQSIGQYLLAKSPKTVEDVIKLSYLIYEYENRIVDLLN